MAEISVKPKLSLGHVHCRAIDTTAISVGSRVFTRRVSGSVHGELLNKIAKLDKQSSAQSSVTKWCKEWQQEKRVYGNTVGSSTWRTQTPLQGEIGTGQLLVKSRFLITVRLHFEVNIMKRVSFFLFLTEDLWEVWTWWPLHQVLAP